MDFSFAEAQERMYRKAFDRALTEWVEALGFDRPNLSLAAAIELPPELDEFSDDTFLSWLKEVAGEH